MKLQYAYLLYGMSIFFLLLIYNIYYLLLVYLNTLGSTIILSEIIITVTIIDEWKHFN